MVSTAWNTVALLWHFFPYRFACLDMQHFTSVLKYLRYAKIISNRAMRSYVKNYNCPFSLHFVLFFKYGPLQMQTQGKDVYVDAIYFTSVLKYLRYAKIISNRAMRSYVKNYNCLFSLHFVLFFKYGPLQMQTQGKDVYVDAI